QVSLESYCQPAAPARAVRPLLALRARNTKMRRFGTPLAPYRGLATALVGSGRVILSAGPSSPTTSARRMRSISRGLPNASATERRRSMLRPTMQSQQAGSRNDALTLALDRLRRALARDIAGREQEWAQTAAEALSGVEAALRQHTAAANRPDG